jgi:acetyl-CoA carboxylase carboxyltransferase component
MSWKPEIDELKRRQAFAQKMGGEEKVARHRNAGKLTVRERIDAFLDPGSFHELGSVAGAASYDTDGGLTDLVPANHVLGRGRVSSRPVVIGADDFTVRGGANEGGVYAN